MGKPLNFFFGCTLLSVIDSSSHCPSEVPPPSISWAQSVCAHYYWYFKHRWQALSLSLSPLLHSVAHYARLVIPWQVPTITFNHSLINKTYLEPSLLLYTSVYVSDKRQVLTDCKSLKWQWNKSGRAGFQAHLTFLETFRSPVVNSCAELPLFIKTEMNNPPSDCTCNKMKCISIERYKKQSVKCALCVCEHYAKPKISDRLPWHQRSGQRPTQSNILGIIGK
jgi:hypothetical protein